jgi:hypothetical protein
MNFRIFKFKYKFPTHDGILSKDNSIKYIILINA